MKHIKSLMEKVGKGEGGFTLIELLIVILILGIIAAVVVLNVGGFLGTGAKQAALMEKDAVQTAVLASMVDGGCSSITGTPPITATTWVPCTGHPLSEYLQGAINEGSSWNVTTSGLIDGGTYTAGGKTCDWNGVVMDCHD